MRSQKLTWNTDSTSLKSCEWTMTRKQLYTISRWYNLECTQSHENKLSSIKLTKTFLGVVKKFSTSSLSFIINLESKMFSLEHSVFSQVIVKLSKSLLNIANGVAAILNVIWNFWFILKLEAQYKNSRRSTKNKSTQSFKWSNTKILEEWWHLDLVNCSEICILESMVF